MAGTKTGEFRELISPFLNMKLAAAAQQHGIHSRELRALMLQYVKSEQEDVIETNERRRHYESEMDFRFEDKPLVGVERLYRRTALIEPTTVCAAHCRWCIRGQYPITSMTEEDIVHAARYFGSAGVRDDLQEVLVTGGDPVMSLPLLRMVVRSIVTHAPNIKIIRIGSRVVFHDPRRINKDLLALFAHFPQLRFEIGVNVNHPVEFWPESISAIERLLDAGVRIYNQHPLLKGVNDDLQTLIELYGHLRDHNIDAHYLFHAIPLRGMSHHRTSIEKGLELATQLSSCGEFSGRAKPMYTILSDIGKITLYEGVIQQRNKKNNTVLLRSGFRQQDRMRWNPAWKMQENVIVDDQGFMSVWYLDGNDDPVEESAVNELYHTYVAGQ